MPRVSHDPHRPATREPRLDPDPLAGDDEPWAPEDFATAPAPDDGRRFFVGLAFGLLFSALAWAAIAALAYAVAALA